MLEGKPQDYLACSKEEFIANFHPKELYRLFVDGMKQRDGWKKFENREPGYLGAMFNTFFVELDHLNEELSVDIVKRIHGNAINGVKLEGQVNNEFRPPNEFVGFNLHLSRNLSHQGFEELKALQAQGIVGIVETEFKRNNNKHKTLKLVGFQGDIEEKVKQTINDYNTAMRTAPSIDEKVTLIVKMVSTLERIHPFQDANCRTLCMVVLYRELLRNGLMPPILNNPNEFDGCSISELCQQIKDGMARSKALIEGRPVRPFFTMGLLATTKEPEKPQLPEDIKDLTKIENFIVIPGSYSAKHDAIEGEKEDEVVYKMILMEALSANPNYLENSKSPFLDDYKAMLNNLASDVAQTNPQDLVAQQRLLEAIQYGCNQQVKYVLTQLKKQNISLDFIGEYVVKCYQKAQDGNRADTAERLKVLITESVHQSLAQQNTADLMIFLKNLYHSNPSLYEDIVDYVNQNPIETEKPDLSVATNIIEAANRARTLVQRQIESKENELNQGRPNLFQKIKLNGELQKLKEKLKKVDHEKENLLKAVNSDKAHTVEQLIERAHKTELSDNMSIYTHYFQVAKANKNPVKKVKRL